MNALLWWDAGGAADPVDGSGSSGEGLEMELRRWWCDQLRTG